MVLTLKSVPCLTAFFRADAAGESDLAGNIQILLTCGQQHTTDAGEQCTNRNENEDVSQSMHYLSWLIFAVLMFISTSAGWNFRRLVM